MQRLPPESLYWNASYQYSAQSLDGIACKVSGAARDLDSALHIPRVCSFHGDGVMIKVSTLQEFDLFVTNMVNTQTSQQLFQLVSSGVKTR